MTTNPILLSDSYKYTHWRQYPPGTEKIYSYFESRGGLFPDTVFFGLQYILGEHMTTPITEGMVNEAEQIISAHLGDPALFNHKGWMHIVNDHGGRFPVVIKAVPEGTVVPTHNVLMTVENTCPRCFWVVNFLETILAQVWYPCTVATLSRQMKLLILSFLEKTGDPSLINFKLQDFGFRGTSSVESAGIGGLAHLVNFMGTDTVAALMVAREHYGANMAGFSIPASEHSTITSWVNGDEMLGEQAAFSNMVYMFGNQPLYACVSDSYDIYRACGRTWGMELKNKVLNAKGTLVVRPDSGTPHVVVVECLDILGSRFGYTKNDKGYKVLNPKVRVIQGDGIEYEETKAILFAMEQHGWSADNVAFGMGGGLLQKVNRDTQKFAFKCSSATIDGLARDVYKKPITDSGKNSKRGRLALVLSEGKIVTRQVDRWQSDDILRTVYLDGELVNQATLEDIRKRAAL